MKKGNGSGRVLSAQLIMDVVKAAIILVSRVALVFRTLWKSQRPVARLYDYRIDVLAGNGALFVK
jgi:hypothetical protein